MATSENKGEQLQSFRYQQEARARIFNKLLRDVFPAGIYEGQRLERVNDTTVRVTPGTCIINTTDNVSEPAEDIALRVETRSDQDIDLALSGDTSQADRDFPYIVFRFEWSDEENNYMDMRAVAYSNDPAEEDDTRLKPNDLIVGKVLFELDGSNNWVVRENNPFEYSRRSAARLPQVSSQWNNLRVRPSEDFDKRLSISSGEIITSKGFKTVSNGNFPSSTDITDTGAQGRHDLIWIDEDGNLQITYGSPSASPSAPSYMNRYVIAELRRGPNRTTIEGPDIVQIQNNRRGMITASGIIIEDVSGNFSTDNVEEALKQLGDTVALDSDLQAHIDDNIPGVHNTGTAAGADLTTSSTDTTSGRVTKVGDFGIGIANLTDSGDLDDYDKTSPGYFYVDSAVSNNPGGENGYLSVLASDGNTNSTIQVFYSRVTQTQYLRDYDGSTWSGWREYYHTGNLEVEDSI